MTYNEDIENCVRVLREGGIILYPTDTVWGLGCDPGCRKAVERIFGIKKRHESKSLILIADSIAMVQRYVSEIPEAAMEILEVSTDPLTIIYPGAKNLADGIAAEDGTVGIRITADKFCNDLTGRFRKPLVSTSANISGDPAPGNFTEVSEEIIGSVDYVVHHRRNDRGKHKPSPVIKIELNGVITILRK